MGEDGLGAADSAQVAPLLHSVAGQGVCSVLHEDDPGDAGVSWLAQSCCLPDEPGEENKGNQSASSYVRAVLCMKVGGKLKA